MEILAGIFVVILLIVLLPVIVPIVGGLLILVMTALLSLLGVLFEIFVSLMLLLFALFSAPVQMAAALYDDLNRKFKGLGRQTLAGIGGGLVLLAIFVLAYVFRPR